MTDTHVAEYGATPLLLNQFVDLDALAMLVLAENGSYDAAKDQDRLAETRKYLAGVMTDALDDALDFAAETTQD
jgi:hypothetical protein